MITVSQYFGLWLKHPDATAERKANASYLLSCCAKLQETAEADNVVFLDNPLTRSGVSGQTYGGFRPQECNIGAPHSAHKDGYAVDRYDPDGNIDEWCLANQLKLAECGIYIELPSATKGWSHWSVKKPASGNRVFTP